MPLCDYWPALDDTRPNIGCCRHPAHSHRRTGERHPAQLCRYPAHTYRYLAQLCLTVGLREWEHLSRHGRYFQSAFAMFDFAVGCSRGVGVGGGAIGVVGFGSDAKKKHTRNKKLAGKQTTPPASSSSAGDVNHAQSTVLGAASAGCGNGVGVTTGNTSISDEQKPRGQVGSSGGNCHYCRSRGRGANVPALRSQVERYKDRNPVLSVEELTRQLHGHAPVQKASPRPPQGLPRRPFSSSGRHAKSRAGSMNGFERHVRIDETANVMCAPGQDDRQHHHHKLHHQQQHHNQHQLPYQHKHHRGGLTRGLRRLYRQNMLHSMNVQQIMAAISNLCDLDPADLVSIFSGDQQPYNFDGA